MNDYSVDLLDHFTAPVREWLDKDGVTEVIINKPNEVAVERRGEWQWYDVKELDLDWLQDWGNLMANYTKQDLTKNTPLCSTSLPTGERVQIVAPPAVETGYFSIAIRKPSDIKLTMDNLVEGGLFDKTAKSGDIQDDSQQKLIDLYKAGEWQKFLTQAVLSKRNILISGATGSGKTTLSKALIEKIPAHERVLTIEDTRELVAPQKNHVHMIYSKGGQGQANISAKELLEASLRMRPDRILLQELRDGTAFYYLRNVNSGHPGSITTVHADSAALAFEQLTLLVKESDGGSDLARDDIRSLLHLLVDIVVQCKKIGGEFLVTEIWFSDAENKI